MELLQASVFALSPSLISNPDDFDDWVHVDERSTTVDVGDQGIVVRICLERGRCEPVVGDAIRNWKPPRKQCIVDLRLPRLSAGAYYVPNAAFAMVDRCITRKKVGNIVIERATYTGEWLYVRQILNPEPLPESLVNHKNGGPLLLRLALPEETWWCDPHGQHPHLWEVAVHLRRMQDWVTVEHEDVLVDMPVAITVCVSLVDAPGTNDRPDANTVS